MQSASKKEDIKVANAMSQFGSAMLRSLEKHNRETREKATLSAHTWKPGDHFYTASGDGGAFYGTTDIGDLAVECREKWHAEENAMTWLADLSEREKDLSAAWVTEYVVISVDDSGKIGEARSVKNGCNEVHRR